MDTTLDAVGRRYLVALDVDHPGFRDREYRARRDAIAHLALEHQSGQPAPTAPYTPEEHSVWRDVWSRLAPLHDALVCGPLRDVERALGLSRKQIPQLRAVNSRLEQATGLRMEPVAGLIESRPFLTSLADGIFLSTQYIRHASRPDFTPEPDIVHELAGHASSLTHPRMAEVSRAFGRAARRASDREFARLVRAYWFTFEYGVVLENGEPKAFGAALLSSVEELGSFRDTAEFCDFDIERIASTDYDENSQQTLLFVAASFDALLDELTDWLD